MNVSTETIVVSAKLSTIQVPVLPVGSIHLDDLMQRYLVRIGRQKYPFLTPSELTQYAFLSIFRIVQKVPLVGVDNEHFWDCVMSGQNVAHICLLPDTEDGRNWFHQAGHQTAILFKDVVNVKGFVRRVFLNLILDDIENEQRFRAEVTIIDDDDYLSSVRQPDLPPDIETQLLAIAKSIPRVISATPDLTSREREILRLETLRLSDVDDLPAQTFDQVAQAAGTSGPKLRAHVEDHDELGHVSASDRKAWSRARAKVAKAFTRAKLTSLLSHLALVFALSLGLLNAIHQGRSIHQNDFVNQGSLIDENALAHQGNLIDEIALAQVVLQKLSNYTRY